MSALDRVRVEKVSPEQYDAIQRTLADPRLGSEEAVIKACEAAGIKPPTWYQEVRLEVVYPEEPKR